MTDEETFDFIQATVKSVWALELLLLLHRNPDRAWRRQALVLELRSSEVVVNEALQELRTAGLVAEEPDGTHRFQPASAAIKQSVDAVQAMYAERPMAVIKAITGAPNDKLRIFSDAFKLRDT